MKEWLKKILIYGVIFFIIYFVIYKVIQVPAVTTIPQGYTKVVHAASRWQSALSLSFIVWVVLYEIVMLIHYINTTINQQTFRSNLIKFVIITFVLMVLSIFAYFMFRFTSINIFGT